MTMSKGIAIRDVFKLSSGMTVLACDRPELDQVWRHKRVELRSALGEARGGFMLVGERQMNGPSVNPSLLAVETAESVDLTSEEARSGNWRLDY